MPIQLRDTSGGEVLEVTVSGKPAHEDYQQFAQAAERLLVERRKISILFIMEDFHGWQMGAIWDDIKFDVKHFSDIERLAMVGDKKWEKGMSVFCKPFTAATVRYFDRSQEQEARLWVEGAHSTAKL